MPTHVYANNNEVASKAADGKSIAAFPDVCFSPPAPPAGPIPLPYPNTGEVKDTDSGTAKVFVKDKMSGMAGDSYMTKSMGDEPATKNFNKGMITGALQGKCYFGLWSMDVNMEGKGVPRHLDMVTHNHGSMMCEVGGNPAVIAGTPSSSAASSEKVHSFGTRSIHIKIDRKHTFMGKDEDNREKYRYISGTYQNSNTHLCHECYQFVNFIDESAADSNHLFNICKGAYIADDLKNNNIQCDKYISQAMFSNTVDLEIVIVEQDTNKKGPFEFTFALDMKPYFSGECPEINHDETRNKYSYIELSQGTTAIVSETVSTGNNSNSLISKSVSIQTDDDGNTCLKLRLTSFGNVEYSLQAHHEFETDGKRHEISDKFTIKANRIFKFRIIHETGQSIYPNEINKIVTELRRYGIFLIQCNKKYELSKISFSKADQKLSCEFDNELLDEPQSMCLNVVLISNFNKYSIVSTFNMPNPGTAGIAAARPSVNTYIDNTIIIEMEKNVPKSDNLGNITISKKRNCITEIFIHEFCHVFGMVPSSQFGQFEIPSITQNQITLALNKYNVSNVDLDRHCIRTTVNPKNRKERIVPCLMAPETGYSQLCTFCQNTLNMLNLSSSNSNIDFLHKILGIYPDTN